MRRCLQFIFALLLLSALAFSQATSANLKQNAINETLGGIVKIDQYTAYDNFISRDGNEYVVVMLDSSPSFLLMLVQNNGIYKASIVADNSTIRNVIEQRYQSYSNRGNGSGDAVYQADALLKKFNDSRYFYEAKYDLLLGLGGKACASTDECRQDCRSCTACAYVLDKDGSGVLDDALAYSKIKNGLDALSQRENDIADGKSNISGTELLDTYLDIISGMENSADMMANANVQKPDNPLYAGKISYDVDSLLQARDVIQGTRASVQMSQDRENAITNIQKITAMHAPAPVANVSQENAVQTNVSAGFENASQNAGAQNAQNNEEANAPVLPIAPQAPTDAKNIVIYAAAGILMAIIFMAAYYILRNKKGGSGIFSSKAKSLENL